MTGGLFQGTSKNDIAVPINVISEFTIDLAKAANTYDIAIAHGNVLIENYAIYVSIVGATFTSVAIKTNDTTAYELLTATEGGVANLTAEKNLSPANKGKSIYLKNGKKLQYTMVGPTGTGQLKLIIVSRPISPDAEIR